MRDRITRLAFMAAMLVTAIGLISFGLSTLTPSWERVDSFDGGYSLMRYEGGMIAEEKSFNGDNVLLLHRYTDDSNRTHILIYNPATGTETGHTIIE